MYDRIADFLATALAFWIDCIDTMVGLWEEFLTDLEDRIQYIFTGKLPPIRIDWS